MEEQEKLRKYKLSQQEHDFYYKIIKRTYTSGKIPVQNPTAVIIGGQTGAGKSGLIGYSTKMFKDGNVIIINSDEIKPFHPQSEEIARLYPKLYTKITDQESNTWNRQLFEELRREGYNIIFEGTMKNNRIADESITELEQLGYNKSKNHVDMMIGSKDLNIIAKTYDDKEILIFKDGSFNI